MSHQMAAEGGEWALSRILGQRDSQKVEMIKSVYGIGTEYGVLLPFSRTQESEADSIGLTLEAVGNGLWAVDSHQKRGFRRNRPSRIRQAETKPDATSSLPAPSPPTALPLHLTLTQNRLPWSSPC